MWNHFSSAATASACSSAFRCSSGVSLLEGSWPSGESAVVSLWLKPPPKPIVTYLRIVVGAGGGVSLAVGFMEMAAIVVATEGLVQWPLYM